MVNRIIAFSFIWCALLALALSLAGVNQIEPSYNIYKFFSIVEIKFKTWENFKIQEIGLIDLNRVGGNTILQVLSRLANMLFVFINVIVKFLNMIVAVFKFIFAIFASIKQYIELVQILSANSSVVSTLSVVR